MSFELVAGVSTWLWDKYGKDITDKAFEEVKEKWKIFKWKDAALAYRERVNALYSTTRILGNPKPIVIEDIFTDVYILDKLTAFRRFDIEQLKEMFAKRDLPRLDNRKYALRIVTTKDRLLILGKPGAGKTTFLRYITLLAVKGKINKIPIFVSIKEWADSHLDLLPFLVKQFEICAFPDAQAFIEHILETGQAIVLFDGLDEVNQENDQRAQVTSTIIKFSNYYQKSKCLITCRTAATEYAFEQFTYVEIADFSDKQIQSFVSKWFRDSEIKRTKFLEELYKPDQTGLRELARTPLLLTLLCLAFDETMDFPQRRVEIYDEALDALLKKWDTSRNIKRDVTYHFLSLGRKRQMFARIAAETFEKGEYFLKQNDLVKKITDYLSKLPVIDKDIEIDGEAILKTIEAQHGIFIECAQRIYSFSHSTFQEYFTARYIADNASDGTLERLITYHLNDSRWREVFLLTASLLDNADSFFGLFRRAVDGVIRNDEELVKIIKWANRKVTTDYAALNYPAFARAVALDIDLDRERVLVNASALARASSTVATRDLIRALNRAVNPTQDLSRTPTAAYVAARDLAENHARALSIAKTSALFIALARDLAFAANIDITKDIVFDNLTSSIYSAHSFCLKVSNLLNLIQLQKSLEVLAIPSDDSSSEKWNIFTNDLQKIMIDHRNIGHGWNLTEKQIVCLQQYNRANILLMDCLKLAYVSDRTEIENSLLLPPSG